jgi:hypothetical protein
MPVLRPAHDDHVSRTSLALRPSSSRSPAGFFVPTDPLRRVHPFPMEDPS